MKYLVLAYYILKEVENPQKLITDYKNFLSKRDATGRIYISEEGVNAQMSAQEDDARAFMAWVHADPRFSKTDFKIHTSHENVFPRLTIKYRKQLVAMDQKINLQKGGKHVSPKQWREMLEDEEDYLILDVRNEFEGKVGHFRGALVPKLDTFREFPDYVEELKKEYTPEKTKVMMYCTGGIRCELYSALMKDKGYDDVYQLDGGVIKYGLEEGNAHWEGKLFVFDDRVTIPISDDEHSVVGICHHCGQGAEHYYNCANMDCNELFLSCIECVEGFKGCCQKECEDAPRLRKLDEQLTAKPFRRWHLLQQ